MRSIWMLCIVISVATACVTAQHKRPPPKPTSNLKSDETVIILPTNVYFSEQKNKWVVPIHGWVFEFESNSIVRNTFIASLKLIIDIDDNPRHKKNLDSKVRMFLVDNERNKRVNIGINSQQFLSPESGANGHFEFNIELDKANFNCTEKIKVQAVAINGFAGSEGYVHCLPHTGVSVISDIDDTIKNSNVLDKKVLMHNTFLADFKPVVSMPRVYKRWHSQGASFHYVSSSPWQLYPFLNDFLKDFGFPLGSMHLKLVRVKDSSIMNLFATPEEGKLPSINGLLSKYPRRQFVLVGDSGEKDAEIYASVLRKNPNRIVKIFIHDIRNTVESRAKLEKIFEGISTDKWQIFIDPDELPLKII